MVDSVKCKTEHYVDFKDLPNFCPKCGRPVDRRWMIVDYDESRAVRVCETCDIAWIDRRPW